MLERNTRLGLLSALLATLLAGCRSTSEEFTNDCKGFSIVRGRVVEIDKIAAREFEQLSDGVAMTLSERAEVTFRFAEENERSFEIEPGSILLLGVDLDYLLRDETDQLDTALPSDD